LKSQEVEGLQDQGKSVQEAVRQIDVTVQTHYLWDKEYRSMTRDQLKRLKELEIENQRLKCVVAALSLDRMILTEAARGTAGTREQNF
jgi:putative transposase